MFSNNGKTIHLKRAFTVKVETLFSAWSNRDIFKTWWKDLDVVEMDFRQGGRYKLSWKDKPADFTTGVYQEITSNQKIIMSWDTGGCAGSTIAKDSRITVSFAATSPTTSTLEFIHEFLPEATLADHHLGWTCAMLDLDRYLNEAQRQIREDLKAEVSRTIPASVDTVWDAWTNPEMLQKWFNRKGATRGSAKADVKVGRNFFMDYENKNGEILRVYGEYLEISPKQKLVFSWADDNFQGDVMVDRGYESRVTVKLTPSGKGTRIDLAHDRLISEYLRKDYESGWTDCLRSIEEEILTKA